jgi:hypothetical protein
MIRPTLRIAIFAPILATLVLSCSAAVRIHEFMSSNESSIADEDGMREDWIELHNTGPVAIDLGAWGLSDDPALPFRWSFAAGTVIEAGGHLLVWASGKDRQAEQNPVAAPDEVGGLVVWLRADTAPYGNGQPVANWQDSSGHGNHATQPTAGQRPVFTANAINGLPALTFTRNASQQLFLPTTSFTGMSDFSQFTFLAVARWTGGVSSGLFGGYRGTNNTNSGSTVFEVSNSAGALRLRVPSGIDSTGSPGLTQNQWHLLGSSMDQAASRSAIFRDGITIAQGTGNAGTTLLANYQRFPVGSSFDDTRTFGGQIAEVLVYNRALSALERASLERHFASKYALAVATPGGNSPPHTNFRLSAAGESLVLTRPDGSTADEVEPVALPADISYGRLGGAAGPWALLETATPEAENSSAEYIEPPAPVEFSHGSGVHPAGFQLSLSHPDPAAVIVYTLDGSEPDMGRLSGSGYQFRAFYNAGPLVDMTTTSLAYESPIAVSDRTPQPNRISLIASTSDSNPSYLPAAPVKKATVVRARAYVDGRPGPSSAGTYFVSGSGAFDYPVPLVSMLFNEADFFDYQNGIYVAGVDHVTSTGGRICSWGNFNRNGSSSERAGHFQLFEDGSLTLDQAVGFRVHGNCSRRNAFKSMRVIADSRYESRDQFDHPFFTDEVPDATVPENTLHKALLLRTPSINEVAFCRLYQPVYGGVGGRLRPVVKFFNGEYWGLSYLRDRLDENFLGRHYDLDPANLALVNIKYGHEVGSSDARVFDLDHGIPADMADFQAMRNFITTHSMAVPANYAQALTLLDKDSFIDHLILKIFAGDDHYAPEYVFWRARVPQDEGFGDGRWRVLIKDFDSSLFTANYVADLATGNHPRPFGYELFQSLLESSSFRNDFINRFADLLNAHFQPARFQEIIHAAYQEAQPLWGEMSARWNNIAFSNPSRPFTAAGRDALLSWSTVHPPRQREHIRSHFNIESTVNLTVEVSDPAHGHVRVNTIDIAGDTPGLAAQPYPWTGTYFHNIPVRLAARPAPGHRLAGWRLDGGGDFHSTDTEIVLPLASATTVEAVFEPLSLVHRWDFEHATAYLEPSQSVGGGAALAVEPGPLTAVSRNAAAQDFPTAHLRVNHPLGARLVWALPTTGFENLVLRWESRRSGQGAGTQVIEYSTDGSQWSALATVAVDDAPPQPRSFDLSALPGVADNPHFAIRVSFMQGTGGDAGNHRFDEVELSGTVLSGGAEPATLAFDSPPLGTASGNELPPVIVRLLDATGLPAISYNGPVTLALLGDGSLAGTLTVNAVNGTATFAGLSLTGHGAFQLRASAAGLPVALSPSFRSLALTSLTIPLHLQGGVDLAGENIERVPVAWQARIDGLAPGADYRFANRVVTAGDSAASDGAGNMIFITHGDWIRSTATPGFLATDLGAGHHVFTAGSDGSYTGWFVTEPSGNPRFTPGNDVHFRLLLNDGAGGQSAAHVLTTVESARVLRFGTTAADGSALVGSTTAGPRRLAVIRGQSNGTGRPLAAAPVALTGAAIDARYAPFYQSLVASVPGRWGCIVPNSLATGVRRIDFLDPSGAAPADLRLAPAGLPGTVNPAAGGSAIVLDADAGLPMFLPPTASAWQVAGHWSTGELPGGSGSSALVPAPGVADRIISLGAPVTLGALRFPAQVAGQVNRVESNGSPLVIDGPPALIRIESSAPGSQAVLGASLPVQHPGPLRLDDGGHFLRLEGAIEGGGPLVKSGGGTVELAGQSAAPADVLVESGDLRITGSHPAAIALATGAVLGGNGTVDAISGAGTVAPTGTLTAASSSAARVQAVLSTPESVSANDCLVLLDPVHPLPQPPLAIDLFLPAVREPGDRYPGGLRVDGAVDLAGALAATDMRLWIADPAGETEHLGVKYRAAGPADAVGWRVALIAGGAILEVVQQGTPRTYGQWRSLHFPDAVARADDQVAGPAAVAPTDGMANLIRYAHGVLPGQDLSAHLPRLATPAAGQRVFRFRHDPAKTDLAWVIRSSGDLSGWTETVFDSRTDPMPASSADGWTEIVLPPGPAVRFFRLELLQLP